MATGEGLQGFDWPERYTDFDIRILRDGTWTYKGDPIRRHKLCQLFATVLQLDKDGTYWLVTPGERGRIEVEDAPFTAIEMLSEEIDGVSTLKFRTNLDYWVVADTDHPIRVVHDPESGEPSPYIMVRDGLEALIARPVFYELVDLARGVDGAHGTDYFIDSAGTSFHLGRV